MRKLFITVTSILLLLLLVVGEAYIIYKQYGKIAELKARISRAAKELGVNDAPKPKKTEHKRPHSYWRIKDMYP